MTGSDLHIYRGHTNVDKVYVACPPQRYISVDTIGIESHTCGHEFIGEVVALYGPQSTGRAPLYATLKIGDKVVSPFTTNCGRCLCASSSFRRFIRNSDPLNSACRLGYTARCPRGKLFGESPVLDGGQAQYVLVPNAGATLFNLSDPNTWPNRTVTNVSESSLLVLADILPTGSFAALQCLSHPKVQAVLTGNPWPSCLQLPSGPPAQVANSAPRTQADRMLTLAII